MLSGKINQNKTLNADIKTNAQTTTTANGSISSGGGSGSSDHKRLINRDAANQHPISAITGLQEILDSKLESSTALPLIEDALQNKAKGLYYDYNKILAEKSYWYLTAEIDPETNIGTVDSVISGPYDLGAGGGSGGGGGGLTEVDLIPALDPETGESMWPTYVAVGGECIIGVVWSSTRSGKPTGRGTLYCYVNGKLVETKSAQQGLVEFDITNYIISGDNKIEVRVIDTYSTMESYIEMISGITLKLASNFEDDNSYTGDINFTYIPTGNIRKLVYFILDGQQLGAPEVVDTSGEQWTKVLPKNKLLHGSHTLEVYFTCELDGNEIRSNTLYYDLICYEIGNNTPIIASPFIDTVEQEQYVSFVVRYRVLTPNKNTSTVYLLTDSVASAPLTVDQKYHSWECRFDVVGNHTLTIRTGRVEKTFNIHVKESTVVAEPVEQALALSLSSYGRSNAEPIEQRSRWDYNEIEGHLTGFNWTSNGWVLDDDGITALRLSGDARAVIEYKPFETDFTSTGKTFEFEIATSDVKNYESRIFECLDGADTITFSQGYAGEDTRTKRFAIDYIDADTFIEKVLQVKGTYVFIYDGTNWDLDGTIVTPEALLSEYGIALQEIDLDSSVIEDSHYLAGDRISVYYTVSGHGFYITPQLAKLQSQQASLSTQYKEGDKVKLAFVVEKRSDGSATFKTKLIYMYINGILSGVSRYPDGDSFQQTPPVNITIGSNDATVDVYTIRIYNNNLTRKQIVNNWIADTRDPVLKAQRYKHNDNYNDENKISLDKIAALGNLPYMVLKGENLPSFKKDRKYLDVEFVNPGDPDRNFTASQARADVQGTSSQYYYRKNFKIKFEGGFEDGNKNWSEHYKMRGDDSKKEKTFTFKADVASSEGTNNVELVRYFEDTKNWYSPAELEPDEDLNTADSKKRIRVGIDGFPIVMFHDNGTTTSFYGKMNFNNDKDNKRTFGFDDGDECWEFLHNTSDLVLFKSADLTNWQDSFESRYPEEYGDDDHAYGTGSGELTKLQALLNWVVSTRRLDTDSEEEKTRKLTKFRNEFEQHFDLDSTLFYYLFTELFLMVDSRAKNAMLAYLQRRPNGSWDSTVRNNQTTQIQRGNKWYWIPYDMDTALGINNEGLLVFNYDREDTDLQEGAFIYNGQDSVFWNNVRDAFPSELRAMYERLRTVNSSGSVGWSYDLAEKYFDDHQAVWSETIFNEDAYTKYLEPYVNNQDATYLGMAQGSKAEQRKWWLSNRFKYLDSKYLTGDAKDTTIMLRAYAKSNFEIKPYLNCYLTGIFDQATAGNTIHAKAEKGVTTVIEPPAHWDPKGVDSVVILYSADLIQDIGDISGFKPGYADFSSATKLQRLIIGNPSPSYENGNLRGLNIGANHLLTYLDARNCKNLGTGEGAEVTPTIDLSQCYSIEDVYFDDTQIKGANFPVGGNLKHVHLPETITSLTIRNHPNLTELSLAGTQNLTSVWLEDIPSSTIKAAEIIDQMPSSSTVRLINIDETFATPDAVIAFFDKLATMHGRDGKGDIVSDAQITGTIHVPYNQVFPWAEWYRLTNKYTEVEFDTLVGCTVTFVFADGNEGDGTATHSEIILRGTAATAPSIPIKHSTIQYSFTHSGWDTDFSEVMTDLIVNALYTPTIRSYEVHFDVRSNIISLISNPVQVVEYNNPVSKPVIDTTTVPEGVEFVKWVDEHGADFTFNDNNWSATMITGDRTISAVWKDENEPSVTITRLSYNQFRFDANDNLGILAWAIRINDATAPDIADDSAWVEITPATSFSYVCDVAHAGRYYIYVKDDSHVATANIAAYSITPDVTTNNDLETSSLVVVYNYVNEEDILVSSSGFALAGTRLRLNAVVDGHYQDLQLSINNIPYLFDENWVTTEFIEVNNNITLVTSVQPKTYTVSFNPNKEGSTPIESQEIVYLHYVTEPLPQLVSNKYIAGWQTAEGGQWEFETAYTPSQVKDNITLYAVWLDYTDPTILNIGVEAGDSVDLNLSTISSGCQVRVDWGDEQISTLTLTASVDNTFNHTYNSGGTKQIKLFRVSGAFKLGCEKVTKPVIVPITCLADISLAFDISEVPAYAFYGATNIHNASLTRFIKKIGTCAFAQSGIAGFDDYMSDKLPDSVEEVAYGAFQECNSLTTVRFSPNLRSLGNGWNFYQCANLETVEFNDSCPLTTIPEYCFIDCVKLENVNIPSNVTTVGQRAFTNCTSLETLYLGEHVTNIGIAAFMSCTSLSDITIAATEMSFIGDTCFQNCPLLETAGPIGGDYNIKFGWTQIIPTNAFAVSNYRQSYLQSIMLPNTITTIGEKAFYYCFRLANIDYVGNLLTAIANLPPSLETIGDISFYYCASLPGINIPSNVISIGINAFANCSGLRTVNLYLPNSLVKISQPSDGWFINTTLSSIKLHILASIDPTEAGDRFGEYWNCHSIDGLGNCIFINGEESLIADL